ncbi:MAG: hypothetical protein IPH39_18855 [Sulfuritalea sp.]|nr:hypothetical protein [Sulfuritalea sp.]
MKQAQADMTAWFGQDALNRARSKIGTEKPLAEFFDGFWDRFRQSTVDDLHGIYRMERDVTGKINPNGPLRVGAAVAGVGIDCRRRRTFRLSGQAGGWLVQVRRQGPGRDPAAGFQEHRRLLALLRRQVRQ